MSAHVNFQGTSGFYNLMSTEMLSRVLGTLGCSHRPMEFICGNDLDMPRDQSTCNKFGILKHLVNNSNID